MSQAPIDAFATPILSSGVSDAPVRLCVDIAAKSVRLVLSSTDRLGPAR